MNKRERMLLIAVGVVILGITGIVAYRWIAGICAARYKEIARVEKEFADQKRIIDAGQKMAAKVKSYEARALPPQLGQAGSIYHEFLVDIAKEKAGLRDVNVRPTAGGVHYYAATHALAVSHSGKNSHAQTV